MNFLDDLKEVNVNYMYNNVYTDKFARDPYLNNIIFISLIGYNNSINEINKLFASEKEYLNVTVKNCCTTRKMSGVKYNNITKKKDINFSHTIIYLEDSYKLDEDNDEEFTCYIYLNKSEDYLSQLHEELYNKLKRYSSIPILKEWIPYLTEKLLNNDDLREMYINSIEDNIRVYKLIGNKCNIKNLVTDGLKFKEININNNNDPSIMLNTCNDLNSYLNTFGESLAKKIQDNFIPKFTPGEDEYSKYTNQIDDYIYLNSNKEIYEAQKAAIQSIVNNWKENNNTIICGEMGTGKTVISASSVYVHNKNNHLNKGFNCLILCPSHLINNWETQLKEYIPNSKIIVIENLKELIKIEPLLKDKLRCENVYIILSKETAKLSYLKRPCAIWKDYIPYSGLNNKYYKGRGTFVCPECGKPLLKTIKVKEIDPCNRKKSITVSRRVHLNVLDFLKENPTNCKCTNKKLVYNKEEEKYEEKICGCKLWEPITPCNLTTQNNKQWIKIGNHGWITENSINNAIELLEEKIESPKEKITVGEKSLLKDLKDIVDNDYKYDYIKHNSNKYSISQYIKDHMKNVFDYLIADEI